MTAASCQYRRMLALITLAAAVGTAAVPQAPSYAQVFVPSAPPAPATVPVPVPATTSPSENDTMPLTRPLSEYVVSLGQPPKIECAWPSPQDAPTPALSVDGSELIERAFASFRRGEYEDSVTILAAPAAAGDLAAIYGLGCVLDGLEHARMSGRAVSHQHEDPKIDVIRRAAWAIHDIRPDLPTGLAWLQWAADAGYEAAQHELASKIDSPRTRRWGEASVAWVARLAKAGRADSMRQLALLYLIGQGMPPDREEAVRLMRKAAEAGDQEAMATMVRFLRDGTARPKRKNEAIALLRRLVEGGYPHAGYYLAIAMHEANPAASHKEAAALLENAALKGDAAAAYELATWYRSDLGMRTDPQRARALAARAAAGGDCRAKIEEAEAEIASSAGVLSPERKKRLEGLIGGCTPVRRRSEDEDNQSGFILSRVTREHWETRRNAAREILGTPVFDIEVLRPALLSGDRKKEDGAIATLVTLATSTQGCCWREDALASLAHPAPWLPAHVAARFDSERWRAKIEKLDADARHKIRSAILSSPLSDQNFGAALITASEAKNEQALLQRFEILNSMGLQPIAFRELLSYLPGAKTKDIRDTLIRSTVACDWNRVASDWIAHAAWGDDECSGSHALRSLGAVELRQLVALGSDSAKIFLALDKLEGRTEVKDLAGARALLADSDPRFEDGEIAQAILGRLAEEGIGGPPDLKAAAAYYSTALIGFEEQIDVVWFPGSPATATRLGLLLLEGRGVNRDVERGLGFIRYGAYNQVALAETAFGDSLWLGLGQAQDRQQALRWYRQAAANGDASAFVRFGLLARLRLWNERSLGAAQWYHLAAQADDAATYLDLARAAALAPMTSNAAAEIRSWLERAATKDSTWATLWLDACSSEATVACFRRQPGFERLMSSIAAGAGPDAARRNGFQRVARRANARLHDDVAVLKQQIDFLVTYGKEVTDVVEVLDELERVQLYHGDTNGAIGTRLRSVLIRDTVLNADNGSLSNYFSLVTSSCHWGEASKLAYRSGRRDAALFLAKVAVNRLQEARQYLADVEGDLRECFIKIHEDRYRWLAGLLIENGRLAEAETVLEMLKDFEHAEYTADRRRRRSSTAEIAYSSDEETARAALEMATNAISAVDSSAYGRPAASDSGRKSFRSEMEALIREVRRLDAGKADSVLSSRADLLASVNRSIVSDLKREYGGDTVALHAVVLPDRIHWIISTAQGQESVTIPISQAELNSRIANFLTGIHTRSERMTERAEALYRSVFEPIDAKLKGRQVKNVLLSLDDRLRYVPFAALHDGNGWLIERYTFGSFRRQDDYLRRGSGGKWTIAGFGASRGGNGLKPLPGVVRELNEIVKTGEGDSSGIIPGVVDLDGNFTRATFADALKREFRVIHIASHFVLDEKRAADSYLLLGDGAKLALLDFSDDGAFTFSNADLVTLSACQTALSGSHGNGSEVDSMATVAQDAGAPVVLASLWSVDDQSTSDLMLHFYSHRTRNGTSLASALREAQLEMIRGRVPVAHPRPDGSLNTHPAYWAPFILLGNPR